MLRLYSAAALLALAFSCAPATPGAETGPQTRYESFTLKVDNRSFMDARVYIRWSQGQQPIRLGFVTAMQSQEYTVRIMGTASPQFAVRFLGSREARITDPLPVNNKDEVTWVITTAGIADAPYKSYASDRERH